MLTQDGKARLATLCVWLRGTESLRSFTPKVGVSPATWNAWEKATGNLGTLTAKRLCGYTKTTFDELQRYLEGSYTLDEYLQLPLNRKEPHQSEDKEVPHPTTIDSVLVWMKGLGLSDLLRIVALGVTLAEASVNNPDRKVPNTGFDISQTDWNELPSIAEMVRRQHNLVELAEQAFMDINRVEAIANGVYPSDDDIISLGRVLEVGTAELLYIRQRDFPKAGNGTGSKRGGSTNE